ncbi:MAG: cadmium-translocating P-type ATPase [Anaerolineales bacterium]|nr:cadmium-translocating P-type ATPase [Anaerolineales bacterium]
MTSNAPTLNRTILGAAPKFPAIAPGSRCIDVLDIVLNDQAGIQRSEFDAATGRLHVAYDPRVLDDDGALILVRQAGQTAAERIAGCAGRQGAACAACSDTALPELTDCFQKLAQAPAPGDPDSLLTLSPSDDLSAPTEPPAPSPSAARPRLGRDQLEVIFTVFTLAATLLAGALQTWALAPAAVITGLYVAAFLTGGYYGTLDGLALLRERKLDVNLLMVLAALGAALIGKPGEGATLLFLFSLSNTMQSFAMDRSRKAIEKLLDLRPKTAMVKRGARLVTLPIEALALGDTVVVRPGERFPIDGEVSSGTSTADQSTITGESIPVEKAPGDPVFSGTLNGNGALEIHVTRLAQDTTLARIVQLVEEAQGNKAHTQRLLDNFEQGYAVFVLSGAALLAIVPLLFMGHAFYPTFYRAMTWLVVASPCALVISTPASILSAIANGARRGILFKGGVHLEQTAELKVVAFDKTGTLTQGRPALTEVAAYAGAPADELLALAAAVELRSEHPLGAAVVRAAEARKLALPLATDFKAIPGQGVEARVNGQTALIGSERLFVERGLTIPADLRAQTSALEENGQTVMLVRRGDAWLGLLGLADVLRPNAAEVVAQLKKLGLTKIVMLTGDNERVAKVIGARAGVDAVHAGLLPEGKVAVLKALRAQYGPIAMVGDGVNDAPGLATADVGVAMGAAGTDVALETADMVLMADNLSFLPYAIGLARQARRIVWQNLAFSMAVIGVLVIAAFGAQLPLPVGVVGHEGSTVLVVLNGLRLLGYRGRA